MKNKNFNKIKIISLIGFISSNIYGQDAAPISKAGAQEFSHLMMWIYLGVIGILVVVTAFIALRTLSMYQDMLSKAIAKEQGREIATIVSEETEKKSAFSNIWYQLIGTGGQTIEQNKDIQINHPHDGIYELDNGMPPWLRNVFVITIIFAVAYFWYYHSYSKGEKGMHYEYKMAMREGDIQKAIAAEKQENAVSEVNVTATKEPHELEEGKSIFIAKCAVCHGQKGEGGVGPNMTDDYWLHGGDMKKIFTVIKYGVPDKGMISWKEQLKPKEMQEVSSYILTLRGTNPPNPKAPQGELFKPEAVTTDTTSKKG
jgi:cytochrome c oxidase cbb3-type subunit III